MSTRVLRKRKAPEPPPAEPAPQRPKPEKKAKAKSKPQAAPKTKGTTEENLRDDKPDVPHGSRAYWLMKAEPESRIEKGVDVKFSIDDLKAATKPEGWDGVRNPVACKNMRSMSKGDLAFFYHSNCKVPGVVGVMEIVQEASVDEHAFDPKHPYHDPKSNREKPRWMLVHVEFRRKFPRMVSLKELQKYRGPGQPLEHLTVLRMSRLSVSKVSEEEWKFITQLAETEDE